MNKHFSMYLTRILNKVLFEKGIQTYAQNSFLLISNVDAQILVQTHKCSLLIMGLKPYFFARPNSISVIINWITSWQTITIFLSWKTKKVLFLKNMIYTIVSNWPREFQQMAFPVPVFSEGYSELDFGLLFFLTFCL